MSRKSVRLCRVLIRRNGSSADTGYLGFGIRVQGYTARRRQGRVQHKCMRICLSLMLPTALGYHFSGFPIALQDFGGGGSLYRGSHRLTTFSAHFKFQVQALYSSALRKSWQTDMVVSDNGAPFRDSP